MPELAEILEALPLPALAVDRRDRLVAANAAALALLTAGSVGRPLALAIRAADLLAGVAEVMAGAPARDLRLRLGRDGAEHVFAVTLAGLGEGEGRQVLVTFRDTSAEEVAEAMRRDFVANVSHELRTPLTALLGFIETLQGPAREDPAARERFLATMAREAGRMNRLVRDLLQLSRVEAEERVRPREPVDLLGVLASVRATLRPVAEGLGSEVRIEAPEGRVTVPGDHDQLVQVFSNLIENGLKYGAAGQAVRVTVRREASLRGPAVRVEVADRGEGIDPVHLPRLTERFYRVDSHRSREKGGTGLGLAIVKHIVARHRGWLRIESVKGEGSTFIVILPEG
ncbi:PAS domain-containing protein [Rhodobacter sp. Har01]|uniref:sensor histidine kinase n=1 Tax=Rhodobacter sp. Har01 TaxID=2883999 RepID=UPI001D071CC8|nr:ATP-binding protein [Rhodobacter sp. Har01]MCB6177006.1 PAS domain-containing protein [Rhodobacter sp. Har01]